MLVWLFSFPREAAGALRTRLSLRPLFFRGENFMHSSGAILAARTWTHPLKDIIAGRQSSQRR
jgi:hypothetical protein